MLHMISTSPYSNDNFIRCLEICAKGDAIVLLEDGVYAALNRAQYKHKNGVKIYALQTDIQARGLSQQLAPSIIPINYERLVDLTVTHTPIQNW